MAFKATLKDATRSGASFAKTSAGYQKDAEERQALEDDKKRREQAAANTKKNDSGAAVSAFASGANDLGKTIGDLFFGGTAKLVNQGLGIAETAGSHLVGGVQQAFGDKQGGQKTIDDTKKHINEEILAKGKGLFGTGGIYNSVDELHNAKTEDVTRKAVGTGLESLAETTPIGAGLKIAKGAGKVGSKLIRGAVEGAAGAAVGSAGQQLVEGKLDAGKFAGDTAIGAGLGGAFAGVGGAISKLRNRGGAADKLKELESNLQKSQAGDTNYIRDNNLHAAPEVDPKQVQAQQEAATAAEDARGKLDLINEHKLNSPYHREIDKIDTEKQAQLDRLDQLASERNAHPEDVQAIRDGIESKYQSRYDEAASRYPEEAAQAQQINDTHLKATQEHMDAQKRLDEVTRQQNEAAQQVTPDQQKVQAHQADLEVQKTNAVAEAQDRSSYPARTATEANQKIDDLVDSNVNPKAVDGTGNITPETSKVIQDAQVERAQTRVDNPSQAEETLFNPTTGKEAPNATISRITADKTIPDDTKSAITNLTHDVHDDKLLKDNANNVVNHDVGKAHDLFNSDDLVAYNPDSQVALGNALVDAYNKAGDPDKAAEIFDKMLTTVGNAARGTRAAASISKVSPQGITRYAENIASKKGINLPEETRKGLQSVAAAISKMEAGPEKEAAIRQMLDIAEQKGIWEKSKDLVEGLLSLPRTIMTSADFSFGLRQGAILGTRYPKIWAKAEAESARMAVDEKYFKQRMDDISNSTDKDGAALLPVYKKMGLAIEGVFGRSEETFGNTSLAESKLAKKLVVGHIVAGSDRAFSGAATVLRSEVAKKIINDYGGVSEVSKWSSKALEDLGRVIDTATGRGRGAKGGVFEKSAPALGHTLFSARLWKSRLDTLNPVYYARLSPAARKVALQSAGSFATTASLALAAASAVGAEVETDPRSSDFGKIKVGDTRYDILGGLQQNIVLAARELMGETKSSTTGEITKLGESQFGPDRLSLLGDFIQNKESPIVSTASTIIKGTDKVGNIINPWEEVAKLFIPLGAQNTMDAANNNGGDLVQGAITSSPDFFGVGTNTYTKDTKKINIADKAKVDAAPAGQEDQYNAFFGAAKNVTGRTKVQTDITNLIKDGEVEKAKRKAAEFNNKVDEQMASYYSQYSNIDKDLEKELNDNLYIHLTSRGVKQRAKAK